MAYAAGIEQFVATVNTALPPDYYKLPVERQRALYDSPAEVLPILLPENFTWRDATGEHEGRPFRVRIYEPARRTGRGVVFYVRGGEFAIGSLDSHHSLITEVADRTAVLPGESSGANMAMVLSMVARHRGGPALISPVLNFTRWRQGGEDAPLLSGGEMELFVACYCPDAAMAADQYVSPLLDGKFHDLPPAYVVVYEQDSLRANGTPVRYVLEPGMVHAPVRARRQRARCRHDPAVLRGGGAGRGREGAR